MSVVETRKGGDYLAVSTAAEAVLTPEDMTEDERMLMRSLREFAQQHVVPHWNEIEQGNADVIRDLFKKAADLGIFLAEVPEQYGGLDLSVLGIAGMMESRSHLGPLASTVFAHQGIGCLPLINFGTPEQIERYLPGCMDGTTMACFALTEPSSGSDAMNIKTAAKLNGEGTHYIVNGSKQFITNSGWADLFILFAKVDGDKFTAFLMDRDTPGLTVGENEKLLGLQGSSVCGLTLDNVAIPKENLLGEIGKGHKVAMCTLNLGRLKMAIYCVGAGKKMLECAAKYAADRVQFGSPIAEFGVIQQKLAEMAARLFASQSMAYRTGGLFYQAAEASGKASLDAKLKALAEFAIECALTKVHAAEMLNFATDEALQTHGGYGYSEEYAPARMYRDARITRIYEGTSEICRLGAMKNLLKKTAQGDVDLTSGGPETSDNELMQKAMGLKRLFRLLWKEVLGRFGPEALLDKAQQVYLQNLAIIAIEVYACESAALRVGKLASIHGTERAGLFETLAELYTDSAGQTARRLASEILAGLYEGGPLDERLVAMEEHLPRPINRIARIQEAAREIVERGGELPDLQNG